jgi:hypothetical protein
MARVEFHVTSFSCEVREDCELVGYHLHVGDQLFMNLDELHAAGLEVDDQSLEAKESATEAVMRWMRTSVGTVFTAPVGARVSDHNTWTVAGRIEHQNHVHWAGVTDEDRESIIGTLPSGMRPAGFGADIVVNLPLYRGNIGNI